jgi:outer membrane protein TolC
MKSTILAPFAGIDHQHFSRTKSAAALENYRVKPADAIAGKKSVTLEDCRKIALANSLSLAAARMEELSKRAIAYSNKTRMLPHFLVAGELSHRDNLAFSYSDVLGQEGRPPSFETLDNPGVRNFSTSHERSTWRYMIEAHWSPTDAALAYYLSQSNKNDRLKAHYQRIRAAQKLISTVDAAYFRLLSLQETLAHARGLAEDRSDVARKMKLAFEKKLVAVQEYSRVNRNWIRAKRLLKKIQNESATQVNILASAMGLSPDKCVEGGLVVMGKLAEPSLALPQCKMEITAVHNRPEAFAAGLSHLNSVNDLKRTIVKYCPKVTGFWRYTRDKDKFLYNKDWKEVGVLVYFDLLDWLANARESRAADYNAAKTAKVMGTVALAIASQVRVAALRYLDAMDEVQTSGEALSSARQVLSIARTRAEKKDLDRIALRALGEANASLAELQGALGTNYTEELPCN